mmetsp:Transcript_17734/g.41277  ORF Transcript_17734/g.41277 Transcript_17734/m.41277 type:complete len:112 (-) Transcript_17734:27-362(-)
MNAHTHTKLAYAQELLSLASHFYPRIAAATDEVVDLSLGGPDWRAASGRSSELRERVYGVWKTASANLGRTNARVSSEREHLDSLTALRRDKSQPRATDEADGWRGVTVVA